MKFKLLNDVWSSEDATTWTSLTSKAAWAGRKNFGMIVYNKKIWVLGGLMAGLGGKQVPSNSIWSSSDGVEWLQVFVPSDRKHTHARTHTLIFFATDTLANLPTHAINSFPVCSVCPG